MGLEAFQMGKNPSEPSGPPCNAAFAKHGGSELVGDQRSPLLILACESLTPPRFQAVSPSDM